MSDSEKYFLGKLQERKANGLYRSLQVVQQLTDFASNDYLGLSKNSISFQEQNRSNSGATGSRLISGNSIEAENAEKKIASLFKFESALIFNSGYCANVGLLSCIANRDDIFIADELVHASMIDGMRLSHAKRFKFKHNSIIDLEDCLQKARKISSTRVIVVIESIYSMDGDIAPVKEILKVCEKFQAELIVDEAHAAGVFGDEGKGIVYQENLQEQILACVYTFGKAYGLHGAMVAGSKALKEFLINFSRPFIYSTALPPFAYHDIEKTVSIDHTSSQILLWENIAYFNLKKSQITHLEFINSKTQIQALILGSNQKARLLSQKLFNAGIYCKAILAPTVPEGSERLRICLHAYNTQKEIDQLFQIIQEEL
jgi:8-amino-7-oxononanoate synthase